MLQFKDCEVSVSGTPIMAENVTLTEANNIAPVVAQHYRGALTTTPNAGLTHSIQMDYVVEANSEPNFFTSQNVRHYVTDDMPTQIIVGGITGAGYLTSYRMSIQPNNLIRASANYAIFDNLSGELSDQPANVKGTYNTMSGSGYAHYWTAKARDANGNFGEVMQADYSLEVNWFPVNVIGRLAPADVKFISATETCSLLTETNSHVGLSGSVMDDVFPDIEYMNIKNLSSEWDTATQEYFTIYLSSGIITTNQVKLSPSSPILNNTTIVKFY